MARAVTIDRDDRQGAYGDVVDVLHRLRGRYGSAVNAAVQIIRNSDEYAREHPQIERERDRSRAAVA